MTFLLTEREFNVNFDKPLIRLLEDEPLAARSLIVSRVAELSIDDMREEKEFLLLMVMSDPSPFSSAASSLAVGGRPFAVCGLVGARFP